MFFSVHLLLSFVLSYEPTEPTMSQLPVCIPHCFIFSLGIQRLPDKRAMKLGQWPNFWLPDETQIERSPFLLLDRASNGFMLLISRENEITKNSFKRIGVSRWTSDTPNDPGAIWIDGSSINNEISSG